MAGNIKPYQTKRKLNIYPEIIIGQRTIILLITVTLVFGLAIIWLNHNPSLQHIWNNFDLDKKVPASFCEKTGISNPVRQPINTFSNIIYLIIAIIIFSKSREERHSSNTQNLFTANTTYRFLFGFILIYVFGASTFYHASLISLAHKLDYSAVFSFSLFPVMYFLQRLWLIYSRKHPHISKKGLPATFLVYIVVCLLLSFFTPAGKESTVSIILILAFFGLALLTEIADPHNSDPAYMALSITSVLVAMIWYEFDKYKVLCNPNSYFQPHSLWNLLIGLSAFYFYLYIRSEHKLAAA